MRSTIVVLPLAFLCITALSYCATSSPPAPGAVTPAPRAVIEPTWTMVDDGDGKSHLAASFRHSSGSALLFVEAHDAANRGTADLGGEYYTRMSAKDGVEIPWFERDPDGSWVAFRWSGESPTGPQRGACTIYRKEAKTMLVCGLWTASDDAAMLPWYLQAVKGLGGPTPPFPP